MMFTEPQTAELRVVATTLIRERSSEGTQHLKAYKKTTKKDEGKKSKQSFFPASGIILKLALPLPTWSSRRQDTRPEQANLYGSSTLRRWPAGSFPNPCHRQ